MQDIIKLSTSLDAMNYIISKRSGILISKYSYSNEYLKVVYSEFHKYKHKINEYTTLQNTFEKQVSVILKTSDSEETLILFDWPEYSHALWLFEDEIMIYKECEHLITNGIYFIHDIEYCDIVKEN